MMVYVSFDGDAIGQMVGRARLADDVEGIRRVSQSIEQGNKIWSSWVESHGGSVIEMGGDEGALEVPADYLDELPKIRQQYADAVGASVSVGVGLKISESSKALIAAKLRGKDRIEFYTDEVNEIIAEAERNKDSEQKKIVDEYLSPMMKNNGVTVPTVDKPVATQGEHSEAEEARAIADQAQSPEATHAGRDFEDEFHDHARSQEQEDTAKAASSTKDLTAIKQQIVQSLQVLKQQAPIMEQLKQSSPDAYAAMVGLAQAVVGLSRQINPDQPMSKSEDLNKNAIQSPSARMVDAVRSAGGPSAPQHGANNCLNGSCYVKAEALYHLLGGKEAGWTPMHVSHEGGPHWFLKNRHSGKTLDPSSDHFESAVPYNQARGKEWLTGENPSKKALMVMDQAIKQGPRPMAKAEIEDVKAPSEGMREDEELDKMAIADIKPGKPIKGKEAHSYSHVLPKKAVSSGYELMVKPFGEDGNIHAKLHHQGNEIGYLAAKLKGSNLAIHNSMIDENHRGKGLGIPMYEALYAHAKHKLGATHVVGAEHSTSAGRVHQSLSAKHGMSYRPREDSGEGDDQEEPFDGRYFGYKYAIKAEKKADKSYHVIEDGKLEKAKLPMPGTTHGHQLKLPVGSQLNSKIKVEHSDGKAGWVSVKAGQVMSQDPSGHPISSRNPSGK